MRTKKLTYGEILNKLDEVVPNAMVTSEETADGKAVFVYAPEIKGFKKFMFEDKVKASAVVFMNNEVLKDVAGVFFDESEQSL